MHTEIIEIKELSQDDSKLAYAAKLLQQGKLVAFPTETVYGLGGNGLNADAAQKIYAAKGRPSDNPLIIHVATPKDAEQYAYTCPLYYRLASAFMPGPLTVVLPKRKNIPLSVTGGLDSVAVRCPSHPIANRLIALAKLPIAAPSANLSGKPSPTCASDVIHDLSGRVDAIIDGGDCEIGLESTIVKIDGDHLILLRPGGITYDALCMVCENVTVAHAVTHQLAADERPLSPGMKYRHYAPNAPVVLLKGSAESVLQFLQNEQKKHSCAILCYDEERAHLMPQGLISVGMRNDLATQAKRLFHALREADNTNAEIIYAHLPSTDGLGLALYNRMIRAAAHTIQEV